MAGNSNDRNNQLPSISTYVILKKLLYLSHKQTTFIRKRRQMHYCKKKSFVSFFPILDLSNKSLDFIDDQTRVIVYKSCSQLSLSL